MSFLRFLSIPLLIAICTLGLVIWAFPEDLSAARTLGIVLGWTGCSFLLVGLLLMLRETWLARWFKGLERMYRWHHWVGIAAYVLLLAHPLVLAAAAWQESRLAAWQTLSPFSQGWPVWTGWLSLLFLMLGLAATFAMHIPYRTWRWLHIGLGVAVLLGLAHLVLLGIDEPVLPILALAALLLGWRVIRADFGTAAHPYVVTSAQHIADDLVEISLAPLGNPVAVTAGQFILVAFFTGPKFRGCGELHPFTVSSVDNGGHIRIGVKALGDCTRYIQSIEPGVSARVHGGFGEFMAHRPSMPQLWIAGGIGITPFLAVLRSGPVSQPTRLLYFYRTGTNAAFLPELQDLAGADPGLSLQAMQLDNARPDLEALIPDARELSRHECYLCGPPGLIAALTPALQRRGITPRHIHFEKFGFR